MAESCMTYFSLNLHHGASSDCRDCLGLRAGVKSSKRLHISRVGHAAFLRLLVVILPFWVRLCPIGNARTRRRK